MGGALPVQNTTDTTATESGKKHPNSEVYTSKKTFGEHILAFPSYLLHWASRPIGYGIKVAERELPKLLQGERGPYGVYPLFELGGNTGTAYGLLLYHNQLLKYNHKVRIEALFGSEHYNDFDFEYEVPGFLAESGQLELDVSYSNDPIQSLYGGNSSQLIDKQIYATEELTSEIQYAQVLSDVSNITLTGGYKRKDISKSTEVGETLVGRIPVSLTGRTALFSIDGTLDFDFVKGRPRSTRGSRYNVQMGWNRSLTNDQFNYLYYALEWHQFIPVGFLPETRRLAIKSRLQKVESIAGKSIPFFEYPSLGSSYDLRGYPSDRYRDDGSLMITMEYRYPIWNFADIVLFVDEGQVFNQFSDIKFNKFHTGYGFGFHIISTKGFAFRTEFAFSEDYTRLILSINPNF